MKNKIRYINNVIITLSYMLDDKEDLLEEDDND